MKKYLALLIAIAILSMPYSAYAALTLDGTVTAQNSSRSTLQTGALLTTTKTNDVIVLVVFNENDLLTNPIRTVSSISDTAGLHWNLRLATSTQLLASYTAGQAPIDMEVWWASTTAVLTNDDTTVTFSGAYDDACLVAFGVNGAGNISSPWDTNATLTKTAFEIGSAATPSTPTATPSLSGISTDLANDFIIGSLGSGEAGTDQAGTAFTAGTGFSKIGEVFNTGASNQCDAAAEYKVVSATQSNSTIAYNNAGSNWILIGDAITADAPAVVTTTPTRHMRLFEGFKIKFVSGKLNVLQQ